MSAAPRTQPPDPRHEAILALARAVPEGFVTTYGDLSPAAPRLAGTVLARCVESELPWHRVVRADGSLAQGERQRLALEAEGVPLTRGRVRMELAHLPREALLDGCRDGADGRNPLQNGRSGNDPIEMPRSGNGVNSTLEATPNR